MLYFVDIEADGFLEEATKIHCMSVKTPGGRTRSFTEFFEEFFQALSLNDTVVMHNGFGYDLPLLEKFGVLQVGALPFQTLDTLAISREWWPECPRGHSLEAWGLHLGILKEVVEDWENLPLEVYVQRCETDVEITEAVYNFLLARMGV